MTDKLYLAGKLTLCFMRKDFKNKKNKDFT